MPEGNMCPCKKKRGSSDELIKHSSVSAQPPENVPPGKIACREQKVEQKENQEVCDLKL